MSERENLLKMLRGDMPDWLPIDSLMYKHEGMTPCITHVRSKAYARQDGKPGDMFGVPFSTTDSTGGFALPTPNAFILKDIHDWPKVIKVPNIDDFDFNEMARKDLEKVDRSKALVELGSHTGYFQYLMAFMGFTEGLMTMAVDPDEVYDLFSYMADFFDEVAKRTIDAYRPDIFGITDDVASAKNLFMSHTMWQELIKPFQVRLAKHANELGIPIDMHCCGKCEVLIDEWMDFGVKIWNPPQDMNDLIGIKEKYGRSLILNGCSSPADAYNFSWSTEEEIRECIRNKVDKYAPGGSYIFRAYVLGATDDPTTANRNFWSVDEYLKYGRDWYSRH